ncbi:MAG: hypothetical protein SO101_09395 [Lachnospiraceae bacterium]|nr:hypothetical protein [Lachnospiraceae bacterium]
MSLLINYNQCRPVHENYGRKEEIYLQYPADAPRYFLKCYTGSDPQIRLWYEEEQKRMLCVTEAMNGRASYFPRYYKAELICSPCDGCPLICTDFLSGPTLSEFYSELISRRYGSNFDASREAIRYLDRQTVTHICTQVFQMLRILSLFGIWYLDLNPGNLIILNRDFDLALIDHTFCLYTPVDLRLDAGLIRRSCIRSSIPAYTDDPFTPENHLTEAYAVFAASLFFGGKPEKLPAYYRNKLFWLFESDCGLPAHAAGPLLQKLLSVYPTAGTQSSDLKQFFHCYPSLEQFYRDLIQVL